MRAAMDISLHNTMVMTHGNAITLHALRGWTVFSWWTILFKTLFTAFLIALWSFIFGPVLVRSTMGFILQQEWGITL